MKNKKSETLEVRLSYEQKRAFMEACAADRTSASVKLREFIDGFLNDHERRTSIAGDAVMTIHKNPLKFFAGAIVLAAAGVVAGTVPTAAQDPMFAAWDSNGDGYVASGELSCDPIPHKLTGSNKKSFKSGCDAVVAAMDINNDGAVNREEFTPIGRTTFKSDTIVLVAGERKRVLRVQVIEWDATDPPSLISGVSASDAVIPISAQSDMVDETYQALMRSAEETAAGAHYPSEELNRL